MSSSDPCPAALAWILGLFQKLALLLDIGSRLRDLVYGGFPYFVKLLIGRFELQVSPIRSHLQLIDLFQPPYFVMLTVGELATGETHIILLQLPDLRPGE